MKRIVFAALIVAAAAFASRGHLRALLAGEAASVGALSTPEALPSPAGPGSGEPNLDLGANGEIHMTWLEPSANAPGHALRVARLQGRTWSPARTIREGSDFFVNWADFPSVLSLGDGRLAAHWLQRTGSATYAYAVRMAFSTDGGRTWSAALQPHTDSSQTEHGFVSLWPTRDGRGVEAVWLDGRKYQKQGNAAAREMTLATAAFSPDGRVSSPERILDGRICDCCQTSVATTAKGPVIVYRDRSADEIRDIAIVRRLDAASGTPRWTEPAQVHEDGWRIAACPVNGPSVAARGDDVVVAWFTAADNRPTVNVAFSGDAGASFGAPVRVDEGQPAGRVDVALTRDGAALVSWIERTGGDTAAVRVRRVDRAGGAGSPVTIASSSAARASGFPRMILSGNEAIFAWTAPGQPSAVKVARMRIP